MSPDVIADLELFNEKASLLLGSSFADALLRNQSAFMFSWKVDEDCEAVLVGPEGESVDAAFLTLRMFMQDNDRISIANIAKLYSTTPELIPFRSEFDLLRNQISTFLNRKNGIDFFGEHYTNKETIEILLYGSKGHSNRGKAAKLRKLMSSPIVSGLYLNMVNFASANFINGIVALSAVNKKALLNTLPVAILAKTDYYMPL